MESGNEDSSDDGDVESMSSETEEMLEALAESLENQIGQNMLHYKNHVDLINVLKKLADLERLRTARYRMAEVLPLAPNLWLEWLDDEIKIAVTENEKKIVLEIFDKAVADYLCVEIWMKYLEYVRDIYEYENESDVNEARKVFERSLTSAGLYVTKASSLWKFYINYEKGALENFEDNPDLYLNQLKLIGNLYKRMLSCPLIDIDALFNDFNSWLNEQEEYKDKIIDTVMVENIYKTSKEKLEKIKGFEEAIVYDVENISEHYKKYLTHERSKEGSPVRVLYVYERMMNDLYSEEGVWLEYIHYLNSVIKNGDAVLSVVGRSLKNCPTSNRLHQCFILYLEKYNRPHKEVSDAFERALECCSSSRNNFLGVWLAYLEYLRRRNDAPEISTEEEAKRTDELRTNFEKAVLFLSQIQDGDPEYSVTRFWARIEARRFENMDKFRSLMNEVLSDYSMRLAEVWLEYINIERAHGDSKSLRSLLHRALQTTHDHPEKIAKYWLNYEKDEGTMESLEDCIAKVDFRLDQFRKHREKEEAKIQSRRELAKKNLKQARAMKGSECLENQPENGADDKQGLKRKHEECAYEGSPEKKSKQEDHKKLTKKPQEESNKDHGVTVAHDHSKDNRTVFVSNLDFDVEEEAIKEAFESCGKVTDLRLVKDYKGRSKGYCYVEFENSNEALEGLKQDRKQLKGRPMFVSRCNPDNESRQKVFKYSSDLEKNKLFVRGLPFEVTENDLRKLFEKYGDLKGVRVVTFRDGSSKGLAYVEFEDEESAAKAVTETNGMVVGDRKISVAISNPPQRSQPSKHFLGEGPKSSGPRKTGRKQIAFTPRSVQMKMSGPTESLSKLSLASPQPTEQTKQLTNEDFRSLLN